MVSIKRKPKRPAGRPGVRPGAKAAPAKASASSGEEKSGKEEREPKLVGGTRTLLMSLLLLTLLYAAALFYLRPASPGRPLSYDELVRFAASGRLKTATFLDQDARIVGKVAVTGGETTDYFSSYPRSDAATNDLLKSLSASGSRVTVDLQPRKGTVRFVSQFLLPLLILANLFALLFGLSKASGSGASQFLQFGKVGNKRIATGRRSETTFANVAAAGEAVAELSEVRDYLANPKAFEQMGALPPKGVLLVGPPGCGKTLLARAVAGEAKANFFSISGSEFVESLVGVGAARVRDLFRQARAATPAIIFIDELDAVGRQRGAGLGGGHDEREQTLNEILVQIDGFSPTEGVVVIAATNRSDILDPALLRAGRFDRHITVDRPDLEGRLEILQLHARKRRLADPHTDLAFIAKQTPGFTPADLAGAVNEAALLAVREKASTITRHHLEEAVERVVSGPRRKTRIISPEEKRRIAYHEAGHALVAAAMGKSERVQKLSITARGKGIGHLAVLQEDKAVLTRSDMEADIAIAMGGIASEELVLGEPSTGAEHDLDRATNTARDMAGRFGMSEKLGRARVLQQHGEVFLGRDYLQTKDASQPTLEELDGEVRNILAGREHVSRSILSTHRDVLDELADGLINQETLQGASLDQILRRVPRYERQIVPTTNGAKPVKAPRKRSTTP